LEGGLWVQKIRWSPDLVQGEGRGGGRAQKWGGVQIYGLALGGKNRKGYVTLEMVLRKGQTSGLRKGEHRRGRALMSTAAKKMTVKGRGQLSFEEVRRLFKKSKIGGKGSDTGGPRR